MYIIHVGYMYVIVYFSFTNLSISLLLLSPFLSILRDKNVDDIVENGFSNQSFLERFNFDCFVGGIMSKKVWIAIFLVVGLAYAYQAGYLKDILKQSSVEKAINQLERKAEETTKAISHFEHKENSNPKVAYLKHYPVKVWYDIQPKKEIKYWWGGKEKVTAVYIHFKNMGSKRVSFIVDPFMGVYILDKTGDNKYIGHCRNSSVILHPSEMKTIEVDFSDRLPNEGYLFININYVNITTIHLGENLSGTELGAYRGSEIIKLYFTID